MSLPEAQAPWQSRDTLRITGVRPVVTAPEGVNLVVVRVDTSTDGLYGLGCATFHQRFQAVVSTVTDHLAPLVVGRHPADITDITRMLHFSGYWRDGPVLNAALSGVDMALWDIAGKRAGMPVHELLGGRVRTAAPVYVHARGRTIEEAVEDAARYAADGFAHLRVQAGHPGAGNYGAPGWPAGYPDTPHPDGWEVARYLSRTPALFARAREVLGDDVHLLHDVHSRLTPKQAIVLARALEPYRLFFLEDVVAPEHYDRLAEVRAASPVPIAVGELVSSVPAAVRLIQAGAIDFLRLHVSTVGGLTPARKLADLCELTGVQTAWHAPADQSPVGFAANVALDVSSPAFGIQEGHRYPDHVREMFPGTPRVERGYAWPSEGPGWGIDLDERLAAQHPPVTGVFERWATRVRRPDGSLLAP